MFKNIAKSDVKIIDFGLDAKFGRKSLWNILDTNAFYIAPELISGENEGTKECDVWSAGVIIYFMLAGYPPFLASSKE